MRFAIFDNKGVVLNIVIASAEDELRALGYENIKAILSDDEIVDVYQPQETSVDIPSLLTVVSEQVPDVS